MTVPKPTCRAILQWVVAASAAASAGLWATECYRAASGPMTGWILVMGALVVAFAVGAVLITPRGAPLAPMLLLSALGAGVLIDMSLAAQEPLFWNSPLGAIATDAFLASYGKGMAVIAALPPALLLSYLVRSHPILMIVAVVTALQAALAAAGLLTADPAPAPCADHPGYRASGKLCFEAAKVVSARRLHGESSK